MQEKRNVVFYLSGESQLHFHPVLDVKLLRALACRLDPLVGNIVN